MGQISIVLVLAVLAVHMTAGQGKNELLHAPCKIMLNEVKILNKQSNFIELGKFCPTPGRSNSLTKLDGYYMLVLAGLNELIVRHSWNLNGKVLIPAVPDGDTSKNKRGRKRTRTQSPHENIQPDRAMPAAGVPADRVPRSLSCSSEGEICSNSSMNIAKAGRHFRHKRNNKNVYFDPVSYYYESLPYAQDEDKTILIFLLQFKQGIDKNVQHFKQGASITDRDIQTIKSRLKDVILLGERINEPLLGKIRIIWDSLPDNIIKPISTVEEESEFSVNKCDRSSEIFTSRISQYGAATPGKTNLCKVTISEQRMVSEPVAEHPYRFAGQTIHLHGRKLIVNVLWALKNKNIAELLKSSTYKAASGLLNLNEETVKKYEKQHIEGSITAPPKSKQASKPVQDQVDGQKQKMIYNILVSFYKKNRAPKLREVLEEFVRQVRHQQLNPPEGSEVPAELFHCNINTFRKILHHLGYKYGRINKRDAVMFDARIIAWRGRYLKAIRENDALGHDKLPVIFTDETWFDTNSRQSHGWGLKCPKSVQERKDLTYHKHKESRGGRIIILHAGGENGFIHGAMEVYKVNKKDASGDYHRNVDHKSYFDWFNKLLNELEGKGSHIIVIDNAPYHSTSTAPPLNSRKQVLLDWLLVKKQEGKDLPELGNLRVFELQDLVRTLKSQEPAYRIDDLAREKGHKVLRTPPYNCQLNPIELVWSDVKRKLREDNVDQNIDANVLRAQNIMLKYSKQEWKAHVLHVKRLEEVYWQGDLEFESALDRNPQMEQFEIQSEMETMNSDDVEDSLDELS